MFFELIFWFILPTLLLWLYLEPLANKRILRMGEKLPGPKRLPIVGNIFNIPRNGNEGLEMRKKLIDEFGQLNRFWIGNQLFILISDPLDAEAILSSTTMIEKSSMYDFLHGWLGTGLLTSTGQKWHIRRKSLTPAFHFKILEEFIEVFNKSGRVLIEMLRGKATGDVFNIQELISRYALDVICETAMGVEVNAQKNSESPYVKSVREICQLIFRRINSPWLWDNFMYTITGKEKQYRNALEVLHNFTEKVIKDKKSVAVSEKDMEESLIGEKRKSAFLELLISLSKENKGGIVTLEDIREEVDTFMFEGHDTTTSAVCAILFLLSKHPDVQEKLYEEIKEAMVGVEGDLSYQDLQGMKYLERVIKESLRLYPSVPAIGRKLTEDFQVPSGYVLPAGSTVMVSIFYLHRNKDYFNDPEKFNPDNFLPEISRNRHPFAYIPFSAGLRNCIGQKFAMLEMKSAIAKILSHYKIEYAGEKFDVLPNPTLVLQSLNGFNVKLRPR